MPIDQRIKMDQRIQMVCDTWNGQEGFNYEYFSTMGTYAGRNEHMPEWYEPINDLFPPNVGVLCFLNGIDPRGEVILDLACGLGNLLPYLKGLGYHCCFGYDSWSQLPHNAARHFLGAHGLTASILSNSELTTLQPTIIITMGYWYESIMDSLSPDMREKILAAVRFIITDTSYSPREPIPGFERTGVYPTLCNIYEKK